MVQEGFALKQVQPKVSMFDINGLLEDTNTLLDRLPMLPLQPVIQYYANVGGGTQRAVVFGFRTKVEF